MFLLSRRFLQHKPNRGSYHSDSLPLTATDTIYCVYASIFDIFVIHYAIIINYVTKIIFCKPYKKRCNFYNVYRKSPEFLFSTGSLGARSYPLSYVNSGAYAWSTGRLYYQTSGGYGWSSSIAGDTAGYYLAIGSTRLEKARITNKRLGHFLRCLLNSILNLPHNAK